MVQWDKTSYNLGNVEAGKKYTVVFGYSSESKIKKVKVGCGCTVASYDDSKITLVYLPSKLSNHTKSLGLDHYQSTKTATVEFADGSTQTLKIKAEVYDELKSNKESV